MPKLIQNNEFISGSPIMDATPQPNSTHAVQSGGVYTAFNNLSTEISAINSTLDELEQLNPITFTPDESMITVREISSYRVGKMVFCSILFRAVNLSANSEKMIGTFSPQLKRTTAVISANSNTKTVGGAIITANKFFTHFSEVVNGQEYAIGFVTTIQS